MPVIFMLGPGITDDDVRVRRRSDDQLDGVILGRIHCMVLVQNPERFLIHPRFEGDAPGLGLENEIRKNRQASEDYVARTVGEFSETYNYYFNQIRILMDALSNVARDAGQKLFHGENGNLKTNFALHMANELKSGRTALESDQERLIVIGANEEDTELLENAGSEAASEAEAEPAEEVNIAYEAEPKNVEDFPDATNLEE